jgi:deoxyribonuclease V
VKVKTLHGWDLSYKQAHLLQNQLAGKVEFKPLKKKCELIAGLDCALSKDGQRIVACAVVLKRYKDGFELVETKSAVRKTPIPYIPGLLSFREAPACLAAVEKLKINPDVFSRP